MVGDPVVVHPGLKLEVVALYVGIYIAEIFLSTVVKYFDEPTTRIVVSVLSNTMPNCTRRIHGFCVPW